MYYCLHRPQHLGIAAEGIEGTDIILGKKSVQKHQHKTTLSEQWPLIYAGESTFQKCKII
jgi:hypothetical protein